MNIQTFTQAIAFAALLFSVSVFALRWKAMNKLPFGIDRSISKDSAARGVVYAFTTGMMPWAKESTRLHFSAYLRGILFHVGIVAGIITLLVSPWFDAMNDSVRVAAALVIGIGGLTGVAGAIGRIMQRNLRAFSTPDDHASVWIVSAFLLSAAASWLASEWLPVFFTTSALMFVYAPFSKIRHCIYFYFGRLFYGLHIGRRGIVRGLEESHV
jgi:nitrate reductase gamma subunit